jgi:hypothetical protein
MLTIMDGIHQISHAAAVIFAFQRQRIGLDPGSFLIVERRIDRDEYESANGSRRKSEDEREQRSQSETGGAKQSW